MTDAIDCSALFSRYPDAATIDAAEHHHIADVQVAGTVVDEPAFFRGRRTHAMHETFHIRTEHGLRIDVVDNVDLAPRVPVHAGDVVVVAGQFIPRRSGGIIHDTHHCPGPGWHRGGWIEWHGRRFEPLHPPATDEA